MACRYRIECIYECGWDGIFESRETMLAAARAHDRKCIASERDRCGLGPHDDAKPVYAASCPHDNTEWFCGMLGCLDCDKWLDTVPADPKL